MPEIADYPHEILDQGELFQKQLAAQATFYLLERRFGKGYEATLLQQFVENAGHPEQAEKVVRTKGEKSARIGWLTSRMLECENMKQLETFCLANRDNIGWLDEGELQSLKFKVMDNMAKASESEEQEDEN